MQEFTTMAGRRLRDAVKTVLKEGSNGREFSVVIAGLTNSYSQYIATFEEYQVQRYEVRGLDKKEELVGSFLISCS